MRAIRVGICVLVTFSVLAHGVVEPWSEAVLEVGAGMGNMTRHLCPCRQSYIATDVRTEYADHLRNLFRHRPSVHVAQLDVTDPRDFVPFQQQMDTVVCLNVLEHIADDGPR